MFSEQILPGFHEGVKAPRLGVGKHLVAAQRVTILAEKVYFSGR